MTDTNTTSTSAASTAADTYSIQRIAASSVRDAIRAGRLASAAGMALETEPVSIAQPRAVAIAGNSGAVAGYCFANAT